MKSILVYFLPSIIFCNLCNLYSAQNENFYKNKIEKQKQDIYKNKEGKQKKNVYQKKIVKPQFDNSQPIFNNSTNYNKITLQNGKSRDHNNTQASNNKNEYNQQIYDKYFLEEDSEYLNDTITDESFDEFQKICDEFAEYDRKLLCTINKGIESPILYNNGKGKPLIVENQNLAKYILIRDKFLNEINTKLIIHSIYLDDNYNICIKNTKNIIVNANDLKCYQETGTIFCKQIDNIINNRKLIHNKSEIIDSQTGEVLLNYKTLNLYGNTKKMLRKLNSLLMNKKFYKNSNYKMLNYMLKTNKYK